ncbi:fungal-specific transcription factor domain-containing protein [Mariannaea sp. PMI_226]|nr:fungal-specific transcription factor domain-containing protein [Mariannaea sp. PMI_226]
MPEDASEMMTAPVSGIPNVEMAPSKDKKLLKPVTHIRRQRAKRACAHCRSRRVRCDVVTRGNPCTNCRKHSSECVVESTTVKWLNIRDGRPKGLTDQPAREWGIRAPTPQSIAIPTLDDIAAETSKQQDSTSDGYTITPPQLSNLYELTRSDLENDPLYEDAHLELNFPPSQDHFVDDDSPPLYDPVVNEESTDDFMSTLLPCTTSLHAWDNPRGHEDMFPTHQPFTAPSTPATFITFSYYRFVDAGAMYELPPQDVSFLEQRGCFHLPARPALDEFLRQYFIYSHPILPLLNESKFWRMYSTQHRRAAPQNKISLFVLQAILFVSCPFVSTSTLSSLGFRSIQAARKDFYSRAKALFDFNLQKDDVALAQGTLLLTYHSPTTMDKVNTYWLESAIHFARNAHADQYHTLGVPPQEQHVLKRLWWCCILRDRIMSLSFRRPLTIRPNDFDFGQPGLSESDFINEARGPCVYNAPSKRSLACMIASLCELAAILNEVLTTLYPRQSRSTLTSGDSDADAQSLLEKLDSWHQSAGSSLTVSEDAVSRNKPLLLFAKMISIYYYTAKASLYYHILLLSIPKLQDLTHDKEGCLQIQSNLKRSLQGVTDDLNNLAARGLVDYLPNTFVPFFALPFTWNIIQVKVLMTEGQSSGDRKDLMSYTNAMRTLRGLYEITDSTLDCIENIVTFVKNDERPTTLHQNPFLHHPLSASLGIVEATQPSGDVWVDLLLDNPQDYLRIAMVVDFSLARGKFPSERDVFNVFHGCDSKDSDIDEE